MKTIIQQHENTETKNADSNSSNANSSNSASNVEEPLKEYCKKRNFSKTSEPKSEHAPLSSTHSLTPTPQPAAQQQRPRPAFVIQEHHASTLHYDLRLEVDGVLKSWAVPKGVSLDPKDKRLAVPTEDHPLAYQSFAGTIPEGEYGAGEVIIWDKGWYENLRDVSMSEAAREGKIEVKIHGDKIRGKYVLIRMKYDKFSASTNKSPASYQNTKKAQSKQKQPPWLVFKTREDWLLTACVTTQAVSFSVRDASLSDGWPMAE